MSTPSLAGATARRGGGLRRAVAALWLPGAAGIAVDAITGPFTVTLFLPAVALCLASAGTLLWIHRRVLIGFADHLDERETELRARIYQAGYTIVTVVLLAICGAVTMLAREHAAWHLKEAFYLVPLTLFWVPGVAATFLMPADEQG